MRIELDKHLNARGETLPQLARATDIPYITLARLRRGAVKSIAFDVLERLCAHFQCTPSDILILGHNSAQQRTIEAIARAIIAAYDLPETAQRRKALAALEEFCATAQIDARAAYARANEMLEQERK